MTGRCFFYGRTGLHTAARCIAMVALCAGWTCAPARAQAVVTVAASSDDAADTDAASKESKRKELPPKPTFAPEIEKDLADLLAKVTEAKQKAWNEKMGKLTEKLAKTTGLDEQGRKKLEAASQEVVEACLVEWKDGFDRMIRNVIKQAPAEGLAELKASASSPETIGMLVGGGENTVTPEDHRAWAKAVKATLTPGQLSVWEKSVAEDRQKLKAEIGDRLDAWLSRGRDAMEQSLFSKVGEMSRSLNLPKERADQIKTLAKNAVDESMGKWRERQEKWLAAMDDEPRRKMLKNRQVYFSPNPDESPEKMAVWKTGLDKLLSADERKRLEAEAADHTARCAQAFTRLMVAEIDRRVALTADQRRRIEPICDRLAAKSVGILSPQSGQGYQQIDIVELLAGGLKSSESEVLAILEPVQWQHWLDACDYAAQQRRGDSNSAPTQRLEEKPVLPDEPEDFERTLSNYLEEKAQKVRQKALADSLLLAEDAGRAANLPADKVEQLKTAARGAVEESLRNWRDNADQMVHSFVREAPVRFVQGRLESLQEYNFQRRGDPLPESEALWVNALKANLDAQQTAAAGKSTSEREAFRTAAVAAFVVAVFDQSHHLASAQQTAMTTAVTAAVKEYQPDILNYFSGNNSVDWYLQSYSMFLPIAAVPETELKSILGPECFDLWTHSPQCSYTMTYWSGLKQNHDSRVKAAKK